MKRDSEKGGCPLTGLRMERKACVGLREEIRTAGPRSGSDPKGPEVSVGSRRAHGGAHMTLHHGTYRRVSEPAHVHVHVPTPQATRENTLVSTCACQCVHGRAPRARADARSWAPSGVQGACTRACAPTLPAGFLGTARPLVDTCTTAAPRHCRMRGPSPPSFGSLRVLSGPRIDWGDSGTAEARPGSEESKDGTPGSRAPHFLRRIPSCMCLDLGGVRLTRHPRRSLSKPGLSRGTPAPRKSPGPSTPKAPPGGTMRPRAHLGAALPPTAREPRIPSQGPLGGWDLGWTP